MSESFASVTRRDALVYGRSAIPNIVGCGVHGNGGMQVFRREQGNVVSRIDPLEPFLLLTDDDRLKGWTGECRIEALRGQARFRRLVLFPDLPALASARAHLQRKSGRPAGPESPYLCFDDPVQQYLLLTGIGQFQGLRFDELRRMQVDLETYCHDDFEFPNARRESDRITAIAMSDTTGWERVISGRDLCEGEMLEHMIDEIRQRDPDVIEGHNFFRFDLNYLLLRAQLHGLDLELGRDGSAVKGSPARLKVGDRRLNFVNHQIFGRHVIDTWFLALLHGTRTGEIDRYGLKALARHFGVARGDRTYIPGDRASWYFDHDPDTLFRYALDDVRETRAVSALLSPRYFFEAQFLPCSYQSVALASEVSKLDALVLREYLAERHSIPAAGHEEGEASGSQEVRLRGRSEEVLRCRPIALHAAIMSAQGCCPEPDTLGVLPRLMRKLLQEIPMAGSTSRDEEPSGDGARGLQEACETILDALPFYLTSAHVCFNDFEVAAEIAGKARAAVVSLARRAEERGCKTIEVGVAGFSFALPARLGTDDARSRLIRELSGLLPCGARLLVHGPYPAMFTYDAGNRALLGRDGQLYVTGAHLRPPGIELFRRECLEEMLRLLLEGKAKDISRVYERYRQSLQNHEFDISFLIRTETLQESLEEYQMRVKGARRRPRGIYEIALRLGRAYLEGDKLSYYVTGERANVKVSECCKHASEWNPDRPDENVEYYKAGLRELYEKLRPFVVEESCPEG